jgi:hypothetical protein
LLILALDYEIALVKIFSIGLYLQHLGVRNQFSSGANTD